MQSTNGTPERPVGEVEEQILHILGICEPNDHKPCWWEDDRPDDRDHLEHGQYGAIIALLATATRTAVEEARVDELNRLIGDIGSLIKGETWEDWGWRVKRAIEARLAALKEQKHE